ncbi:MAG: preprotein translocase subunit YajC [Bacteroidetes bacterium RIFCSPLOWO2_02_FULL_36_8]|nr:MAG: preprotein translocase subunit YajC [Bacteroidetes bacterium RIFCSPLOWO2_02_FULL_36_8]OFY71949.1 MAG: preprotein translocase subunit YajC [Bacteroidetes bacterium RIFCSPLOWO2_12_FULL_37_12]
MNLLILLQTAPAKSSFNWSTPVMFLLIFLVFYFFMIRPQQKKQKTLQKFRENLNKGDKVVTIGGIHGKIAQIENDHLFLEIDNEVKIKVEKSAISQEYSAKVMELRK